MTTQELQTKLEQATKKFTDVCFEMGLSPEKTRQLLVSKQGLEMLKGMIQ